MKTWCMRKNTTATALAFVEHCCSGSRARPLRRMDYSGARSLESSRRVTPSEPEPERSPGSGQPWFVVSGSAAVDLNTGELQFQVEGLVLAGGNAIGTPGAVTQVKGTLVCDTVGSLTGNSTLVDTALVHQRAAFSLCAAGTRCSGAHCNF